MSKFYPVRGKTAVVRHQLKEETTSAGIIYNKKEQAFVKGQVVSVGEPTILPSGKEVTTTHKNGDWVVYHQQLAQNISGFDILKHEDIIAVVDEDTDMTQ